LKAGLSNELIWTILTEVAELYC